jgi:selenocysteine lyase/cysteine desulfurase
MNVRNLARALEADVQPGDEFILTGEHEANCGPWKQLAARRGAVVKYWRPTGASARNPYAVGLRVDTLLPLVSAKTRLVAFPACSNILGAVAPVEAAVRALRERAREAGAGKVQVSVDCVAYAPHRRMDVRAWDVDFCVFSFYKVYGPHVSALYVRRSALAALTSLAHHFLQVSDKAYKLEPGGPGYELVYGASAVLPYLLSITPARSLDATFAAIAAHEQTLLEPLLQWLGSKHERGVRIVGQGGGADRVPTVSFVVVGPRAIRSRDVVKVFDQKGGIGIRWGHFYAYTLVEELEPMLDMDGVVRISLVHYNTVQEVERIVEMLEEVLA